MYTTTYKYLCYTLGVLLLFTIVGFVSFSFSAVDNNQVSFRSLLEEEDSEEGISGGKVCTADAECSGSDQGTCTITSPSNTTTSGVCTCKAEYAASDCSYKRKLKLTAFLLSFLLGGWGADRFYLGYIGLGVLKLILTLLNCYGSISLQLTRAALGEKVGEDKKTLAFAGLCILACCCCLGTFVFWLVDWILILQDELPDYDGYALFDNF